MFRAQARNGGAPLTVRRSGFWAHTARRALPTPPQGAGLQPPRGTGRSDAVTNMSEFVSLSASTGLLARVPLGRSPQSVWSGGHGPAASSRLCHCHCAVPFPCCSGFELNSSHRSVCVLAQNHACSLLWQPAAIKGKQK